MKRELSSFDIYALVSELQELSESHIKKSYQLSKDEILIKLSGTETKKQLYAKNESFLCETSQELETPTRPSTFAMTLRKYLANGKLVSVEQLGFDRIIKIGIQKKEGIFYLIFELFKNGNIILLNPEEIILLPFRIQHWAHRTIKPHQPYIPPPEPVNPFSLTYESFKKHLKESKKDTVRTLAVELNMSGTYAEELCLQASVPKNQQAAELDETSCKQLFENLQHLLQHFQSHELDPHLIIENEQPIDVIPFPLQTYAKKQQEPVKTFNYGLRTFIQRQTKEEPQTISPWEKKRQKIKRKLNQQQQSIKTFQQEITIKKQEGDLLYLHYQTVEDILKKASSTLQLKDKETSIQQLLENPHVTAFDPYDNVLKVTLTDKAGTEHILHLNMKKNVAENANDAYNQGKKIQKKLEGAQKAVQVTKKQLDQIEQNPPPQTPGKKITDTKHRFWFESYRWSLTSEGNVIVAGRDAKTNDRVVKKYLTDEDRFVHADVHGAPSCILKNTDIHGKQLPITEKSLEEACIFAASYSRAWKQFAEAQAYWVRPEQVSKTPQSGEFVPKGAFIIRGKRNYHQCLLELAIGKTVLDDSEKIIAGAESAVQAHTKQYVVIQPGTDDATATAKQLATLFKVSVDEVVQAMPTGPVQIIKKRGIAEE